MSGAVDDIRGPRVQFEALGLLRGVAAIAVLGRHLEGAMLGLSPSSHLAVDLFFVISGFVIAHAYDHRLRTDLDPLAFMRLRVVRLYPLYLTGTLVGVGLLGWRLALGHGRVEWLPLAVSGLLGAVFLPTSARLSADHFHMYPFDFPAWSLFWELAINLVYALVVRRLGPRTLATLIAIGAGLLIACAWRFGGLDGGANRANFAMGGLRVGYSFFVGVALLRLGRTGRFRRFRPPAGLCVFVLIGLLAIRPPNGALYDLLVTLLAFPLLVLAATGEPSEGLRGPANFLGRISYPLYVLHAPFLRLASAARAGHGLGQVAFGLPLEIAFVAGMIGVAALADRYIDRPARGLAARLARP